MKALTEDKRNLVSQNHNLVYAFLRDKHLDFETWYDIAAIGIVKAGITYNQDKNIKFSTFAYKVMHNEIKQIYKQQMSLKRGYKIYEIISYETPIGENKNGKELLLIDTLSDNSSLMDEVILKNMLEEFLKTLEPKEQILINLSLNGYTKGDIAKIMQKTNMQICRDFQRLRIKFRRFFNI